jgi:hypothetical protein
MKAVLVAGLLAFGTSSVWANSDFCVLAGRVNEAGQWAPKFKHVEILDAQGKTLDAKQLDQVKSVRVNKPAPLSLCHGTNTPLTKDNSPQAGSKTPSQHLSGAKQPVQVQAVYQPSLRSGGSLVELKVAPSANRIVMQ